MKHNIFSRIILLLCLSATFSNLLADERPVMTIDGHDITADEFRYLYSKNKSDSAAITSPRDYASLFALFKMKVFEAEACGIDTTSAFQRELDFYYSSIPNDDERLRKEYRDGMLLFEISDRRVWQKSLNDTEGLQHQFENNRDKYAWADPRAKGWIILAHDDDTACEVCDYLNTLQPLAEDIRPILAQKYGRNVLATKFLVKQGLNPVIDALVFNVDASYKLADGWEVAKAYAFQILDAPEDWKDVKTAVATDYQQALADEWEQELWKSHTVVFHYDVIDEMDSI